MTTLQETEEAIRNLPPQELASLQAWFATFDAKISVRQMEGLLLGIQQASNGEWVETPPDFEADMARARRALDQAKI